ncbi:hypothetical protein MUN81_01430 [Hymenobacter sp. 5317J-9]|uniref:hypothetical protein n=1 Tax=unclassified Hymenobacter TaxID=2615202 RepID=UPI0018ED07A6|nr:MULTISPECIES: hypothetical protein [unclassified Hymenobacter]MBJ6107455.1 hypothetical protein [Hymenobacter sp. BT523]UOQ98167.1 hypothetical protein MUN81_01430 [Hymenobacter sp. 5317J-9]
MLKRLLARGWAALRVTLVAGLALALAGCGPKPEVLLATTFDDLEEWGVALPAGFTHETAHSGNAAIKTEPGMEFAATYVTPLSRLSFVPRRFDVDMWVNLTNGRTREIVFVVQVLRDGRGDDVWENLPLQQVVKRYGQWEHVQHSVHLPRGLTPEDRLKVYLWHQDLNGEPTYMDDLRIVAHP